MATAREEAAPTFEAWKLRLEQTAPDQLQAEVERFLVILAALGTPMVDGAKVHFVYHDPDATNVALAGEFNDWGRRNNAIPMDRLSDTGLFFYTLTVPEPARLEYKLIVDGKWKPDPLCQHNIDNGIGDRNSFFIVGEFHDPRELEWAAGAPHGRVEEFEFQSTRLQNKRRIYVYLPAAYDRDDSGRFPAFYVHDGGEYLDRARLPTVMDNLIYAEQIPPLVVVMIDPVNRMLEYWANDAYRDFLCDEFIPAIDHRYRTIAGRDSRGVMGASLGGLISTYVALSKPQLFSKVAGQSSALHLDEDQLVSLLDAAAGSPEPGLVSSPGAAGTNFAGTAPAATTSPNAVAAGAATDNRDSARKEGAASTVSTDPAAATTDTASSSSADLTDPADTPADTPIKFYFDVGTYEPRFIPAHARFVALLKQKHWPCFYQELAGGHNWTSWRAHLKDLLVFLWGNQAP